MPPFDNFPGKLQLVKTSPQVAHVTIQPSDRAYSAAQRQVPNPKPKFDLVEFDAGRGTILIRPIIVYPSASFLERRFDDIETTVFEGVSVVLPGQSNIQAVLADEISSALSVLPDGFNKRAEFGLGVDRVLEPAIGAISNLTGIRHLVVSRDRSTTRDGDTLVLNRAQLEEWFRFLKRIDRRHQSRNLRERQVYAHNHIISPLDPVAYPEQVLRYTGDEIYEVLNVARLEKLKLSKKDNEALVDEASKRISDLKRAAPEKLFRLHRSIELVNLETLIKRFKVELERTGKAEKTWQKIFALNPFILSMIFGYPIVKIVKEGGVGLPNFDQRGAKFADFLMKNAATENAALVELKTPAATLLVEKPYRGKEGANPVYQPHGDLTGAVAQVLDQRYNLQTYFTAHKAINRDVSFETFHVDCVVVAGRLPTDTDRLKSFEIYRRGLKDVRIITFDELLAKIETLRDLLASLPVEVDEAADGDDAAFDSDIEDLEDLEAEDEEEG